jgi:hypothetical protein
MGNAMVLYKKILTDRRNHYLALWERFQDPEDFQIYSTYQSALDMFEYAEAGDYACLAQFDYLNGKEEEEE